MRTQKIRVKRSELIRAVEGRMRKLDAEHKREVEAWPARQAAWTKAVVAALDKAAADARRGRLPKLDYRGLAVPVPSGTKPEKPAKRNRQACDLERVLKTLKIGSEDSVSLDPADSDLYFGPCQL